MTAPRRADDRRHGARDPRATRRIGLAALAALALAAGLALWPATWRAGLARHVAGPYGRYVVAPLARLLTSRFPRPKIDDWSRIAGLVTLGGAPARFRETQALALAHPHLRLVVSGASHYERGQMRLWPHAIRARVIFEDRTRAEIDTTFDNARNSFETVSPAPGETWLLVTSPAHMPRAVAAFRRVGFDILPWPAEDGAGRPDADFHVVHHEWLGLIAYRLSGRSDALFPAPKP